MTTNTNVATEALILVDVRDGVATLTLNRPAQFNALSAASDCRAAGGPHHIAADREVRVVVLAASGRGFCAGHDLKEIRAMGDVPEVEALFAKCSRMMMSLAALPQPVIAKVHGIATAAGCQLVASCDLAVRVRRGQICDARCEHRRLLLHTERGARPGGVAQACDGDVADRQLHRRQAGARRSRPSAV